MDVTQAMEYVATRTRSVLVTQRSDGHPQLSNVMHHVDAGGLVRVSITHTRAKYKNLVREPWAALHVTSDDFWTWVVVEGPVDVTPVARDPHDATVEELVGLYRALAGEHEDWDAYRAAMVEEGRVVVRLVPDHGYGQLPA